MRWTLGATARQKEEAEETRFKSNQVEQVARTASLARSIVVMETSGTPTGATLLKRRHLELLDRARTREGKSEREGER